MKRQETFFFGALPSHLVLGEGYAGWEARMSVGSGDKRDF